MKKVIMLAAVVAALASCQSKANRVTDTATDDLTVAVAPATEVTEVYAGTLPAADGPGIDYVLTLNAATDGIDTTYTLDMTYLDADSQGNNQTFTSKGKQKTVCKVVNKKPVTAVKLIPNDNNDIPMYFMIVNDTTLRLVNDSLQEAVGDLNYDIVKVKRK
ncbi:copper resistance protein NlpE N-terminal domain-containing protein [uncultured Bacteroides sp.]|uniref:copper resistance protein NlpE N-terminal domain-containing protein n=1 Tax=uncultured Bacteroides sp. TaxID=162156 RepID=UPI0025FDE4E0|nr:copper resistance protein NlpE N-terminal domain-containing protein [uncultured Bacteroides sp.]